MADTTKAWYEVELREIVSRARSVERCAARLCWQAVPWSACEIVQVHFFTPMYWRISLPFAGISLTDFSYRCRFASVHSDHAQIAFWSKADEVGSA